MSKSSEKRLVSDIQCGFSSFCNQPINKTITFDGTDGNGNIGTVDILNLNGTFRMRVFAVVTEDLTVDNVGTKISCGVGTSETNIFAAKVYTLLVADKIVKGFTGVIVSDLTASSTIGERIVYIETGKMFMTVTVGNVTGGSIIFYVHAIPLSDDAYCNPA